MTPSGDNCEAFDITPVFTMYNIFEH